MNILPKKRWHVRTKENIARVRRDEALAAEEARVEQARIDKAESEARINLLRNESRQKHNITSDLIEDKPEPSQITTTSSSKHINFFEELEQGNIDYSKTNKDYERDKKEEQEKYEKQIGLLTYLGQGLKEAVSKSWYNDLPRRLVDKDSSIEVKPNKKILDDPMQDIKRYMRMISRKKDKDQTKKTVKVEHIKIKQEGQSEIDKKTKQKDIEDKSNRKQKYKSSSEDDHTGEDRKSHKKHKKNKKHKKFKKRKRDKEEEEVKNTKINIEKLRAERIEREMRERLKAQALLAEVKAQKGECSQPVYRQKYNSQFFPELARQNCERNK